MPDLIQVKASVPRDLKRRAFALLALREVKFNHWLEAQLEALLQESDLGAEAAAAAAPARDALGAGTGPAATAPRGTKMARKNTARGQSREKKMA